MTPIKIFAGTINAKTNNTAPKNPKIKKFWDNPSRNKTNINAQNTKADPVSFCNKTKAIGIKMIAPAVNFVFVSCIRMFNVLKYLANAMLVANFANSEGCSLNEPISIHDLAPCTFFATASTTNNKSKTAA